MFLYTKGILKLFYRFSRQRPIKTIRTIFSLERLLGTIWVELNRTKFYNFMSKLILHFNNKDNEISPPFKSIGKSTNGPK